jgi:hypothetical protein
MTARVALARVPKSNTSHRVLLAPDLLTFALDPSLVAQTDIAQ